MPQSESVSPTVPEGQATAAPPTAQPISASLAQLRAGTVISHYRIESVLGEGGMGVVYLARQERPDRPVALKVIRPGLATQRMLRRFDQEAEVLGRLLHPGIAQIYEAGTADAGHGPQPFFAMELVQGLPLTDYAGLRRLGTRQRLELMAKVCDAVEHAHQKGVIHRDLKPGNILVTEEGQPKILDFGVARATDSDLQQTTLQTDIGQLIGTLPYMSPEQVGGDPAELDTRSDVYALGVVLFELLAGRLPYSLERRMIHEAARVIREAEPTRLSSIHRTLRGDVETIVAHALEKEKGRRYPTASALAADIRRYLADEPITARPASTWYQVRKFSRRNRGLVAGVAAAFAVLILGLGVSLYAFAEARYQSGLKDDAVLAEKERADQLKQVGDFQEQMLAQVDATTAGLRLTEDVNRRLAVALEETGLPGADRAAVTDEFRAQWARVNATDAAVSFIDETILKPAVKAIDEQFEDQPVVDAQLRQVLADRYHELGLYDVALPLQEQALAIRRLTLGEEHPDTLTSISNMGELLLSRGEPASAVPFTRDAMEKRRRVLGDKHPDTLMSINNMGYLLVSLGDFAGAEPLCREAMEGLRSELGERDRRTLLAINNMGYLMHNWGRFADAEKYHREALAKRRIAFGDNDKDTITSMNNMGALFWAQGRHADAAPFFRDVMEGMRSVRGENHPDTLMALNNMGMLLDAQGDYSGAEAYIHDAVEGMRYVLGEEHQNTLLAINNMGYVLQNARRLADAEPYSRDALEGRRRRLGDDHPDTLASTRNMGCLLRDQGHFHDAEEILLPGAARADSRLPMGHPIRRSLTKAVADLYDAWEQAEPGKGYAAKAVEWRAKLEELQASTRPATEPANAPATQPAGS